MVGFSEIPNGLLLTRSPWSPDITRFSPSPCPGRNFAQGRCFCFHPGPWSTSSSLQRWRFQAHVRVNIWINMNDPMIHHSLWLIMVYVIVVINHGYGPWLLTETRDHHPFWWLNIKHVFEATNLWGLHGVLMLIYALIWEWLGDFNENHQHIMDLIFGNLDPGRNLNSLTGAMADTIYWERSHEVYKPCQLYQWHPIFGYIFP